VAHPPGPTGPAAAPAESLTDAAGRTEAANARRLVARFGRDLWYAAEWKDWLVWDGRRWARDARGLVVQERAAAGANDLWREVADARPDDGVRRPMVAFVAASNSARGIASAVTLARSRLPVRVDRLDARPWLLNVPNGTVDLRTGAVRGHRRQDYLTMLCPTRYDPAARCPTWDRFLRDVFRGDDELIGYVRRLLGYGLTGDVREQVLPILWGRGSNGKSTFVNAVLEVLGPDYGGPRPGRCSSPARPTATRPS